MAEIHWIKLSTDLYNNRKIKYLRKMTGDDSLAFIWVMLLVLAGRCNAGGRLSYTETVPFTPKMLADELDVAKKTMLLALKAFKQSDMISYTEDGFIYILGWEEHQSADAMEKVKEQTKLRKLRYREKQKALKAADVPGDVPGTFRGTQRNATDIEEDIDTDTEKEKEESEEKAPAEKASVKNTKQFVPPTLDEVKDYCRQRKSQVDPVRFWEYFDTGGNSKLQTPLSILNSQECSVWSVECGVIEPLRGNYNPSA